MQALAAMVDDAEMDRAVSDGPAAVAGLGEADRFPGERLVDVDAVALPLDLAALPDAADLVAVGIAGLPEHAVPSPRRRRVVVGRRRVAEGRMGPLFVVEPLEGPKPVELPAQAARRRARRVEEQGQVKPFEPAVLLRLAGIDALGRGTAVTAVNCHMGNRSVLPENTIFRCTAAGLHRQPSIRGRRVKPADARPTRIWVRGKARDPFEAIGSGPACRPDSVFSVAL